MARSQASRLEHSKYTCFECGVKLSKSEVQVDGRKYVCGDCKND